MIWRPGRRPTQIKGIRMKNERQKRENRKGIPLIFSIIFVFCILGTVIFSVSRRISVEMSASAIDNLSESLSLIKGTMEVLLNKDAEFQKLIVRELTTLEDPQDFILSYERNHSMVKMSLIRSGETEGISSTGDPFSEEGLDFSAGNTVGELPLSQSYLNDMGTWAYTIKCPVLKDGSEIATLYAEYVYDSFEEAMPHAFYNNQAMLYIMDSKSERLVLKPRGIGERNAGT